MPAATSDSDQTMIVRAFQLDGEATYVSAVRTAGNAASLCSGQSSRSGLVHLAPYIPDPGTRHRSIRRPGQGGMGAVSLREDNQIHSTVAVQILPALYICPDQCIGNGRSTPTGNIHVLGQGAHDCAIESHNLLPTRDHAPTEVLSRDYAAPVDEERQ